MLDLTKCDPRLLQGIDAVVAELSAKSAQLRPDDVMVVGANCRDILQSALGHDFRLRTTLDIDLGLAVADWATYDELAEMLPVVGNTGIRFTVAGIPTDLVPFGAVEDPSGTVTPTSRQEPISVWGFAEVFENALPLALPSGATVRIPSIAGYGALKLAAWLDRSAHGDYKDASDIATILFWYSTWPAIEGFLYETDRGNRILLEEDMDYSTSAARVLGEDIAQIVSGPSLIDILLRWPGPTADVLYREMAIVNTNDWTSSVPRRQELIAAMGLGMGINDEG